MNDQQILDAIRAGKLEKPIKELYRHFPAVRLTLLKGGAQEELIPEIFNDALVLLIEKSRENSFSLTSKYSTFLTGICINKWRNLSRSKEIQRTESLSDSAQLSWEETDFEKEEKLQILDQVLDQIQEKCRQIFQFFYFEKKSMSFIAEKLGFSSEKSAKTQKYKCIEKAHELAKSISSNSKFPVA